MKTAALALLIAFQAAGSDAGPVAATAHMRYERAIELPTDAAGSVCAVLDAQVFEHASSRSAEDLRVFDDAGTETPFDLTENSAAQALTEAAAVLNLGTEGDAIVFDLRMPARAYSEVDLNLDAKNFVAVADVSSAGEQPSAQTMHRPATNLGTFTLFDLTSQHLSRSTVLPLAEATFPWLHVRLRFSDAAGKPMREPASVVRGASVPPSREAQTLYTTVAFTRAITQQGRDTVATLAVPAQVPVERATIVLNPSFTGNFVRTVLVDEKPLRVSDDQNEDSTRGEIQRANLRLPTMPWAPPIHVEQLSVDAVLATNRDSPANVTVSIANGDDPPLPIRAVELAMRQRKICFAATAGKRYTLRYGDPALHAPVYDFARLFDTSAPIADAKLGPERRNPNFIARADTRPFTERHPDLIWIALFGVVAVLGATALASVRQQRTGE